MSMLTQLVAVIEGSIIATEKDNYRWTNEAKRNQIIKIAQKAYDDLIDKPLQLPAFVDYSVKNMLIPILMEFIFNELKGKGVLKAIGDDYVKKMADKHKIGVRISTDKEDKKNV